MTESAHRLNVARAIYLAMYAGDGGDWNAVETKQVWLEKADFVLALLNDAAPSKGVRAGDIERQETQWAEMKPDLYDGDTCDKLRPRWECQADGDHGGSDYEGTVRLAARCFPPGTRVSIQEPLCPKCSELREPVFPIPTRAPLYKGSCRCGFDWDAWVEEQYS